MALFISIFFVLIEIFKNIRVKTHTKATKQKPLSQKAYMRQRNMFVRRKARI